jgi:hypothetical protein
MMENDNLDFQNVSLRTFDGKPVFNFTVTLPAAHVGGVRAICPHDSEGTFMTAYVLLAMVGYNRWQGQGQADQDLEGAA